MRLPHDEGWCIPPDRGFYPALPAYYRNVRFQLVFFQADPAAVAQFLPEPLEPVRTGACVAAGLVVPFCSNYGSFQEALLLEQCIFRGEVGWYCSHVFHDGPAGIAAGREIYGTPKVFASLKVRQVDQIMTTTARMGGLPVLTIASTMETASRPEALPVLAPAWRLKVIPRADGPGPALKQLIDAAPAARDAEVHVMFQGRGTVHFEANPLVDLTSLQPREYGDTFYLEKSYTETFGVIAYDYLAQGR